MKFDSAGWQTFAWVLLAIAVAIASCFGPLSSAQSWLLNLASLIVGSVWVGRPGDVSEKTILRVVQASKFPPAVSVPPAEAPQ